MANMSYCRFQNTKSDLKDCLDAINEINNLSELSDDERKAAKRLKSIAAYYIEAYDAISEE